MRGRIHRWQIHSRRTGVRGGTGCRSLTSSLPGESSTTMAARLGPLSPSSPPFFLPPFAMARQGVPETDSKTLETRSLARPVCGRVRKSSRHTETHSRVPVRDGHERRPGRGRARAPHRAPPRADPGAPRADPGASRAPSPRRPPRLRRRRRRGGRQGGQGGPRRIQPLPRRDDGHGEVIRGQEARGVARILLLRHVRAPSSVPRDRRPSRTRVIRKHIANRRAPSSVPSVRPSVARP